MEVLVGMEEMKSEISNLEKNIEYTVENIKNSGIFSDDFWGPLNLVGKS